MHSHLTISRGSQVCICIALSPSLSPFSPQGHYSDSGPHSLPLWPQFFNYYLFSVYLLRTYHIPGIYQALAIQQGPNEIADLLWWVLFVTVEKEKTNKYKKWGKAQRKTSTFSSLSPWFNRTKSPSSFRTFSFLVILLYLSYVTCNETQRNSNFCIVDGKKQKSKRKLFP